LGAPAGFSGCRRRTHSPVGVRLPASSRSRVRLDVLARVPWDSEAIGLPMRPRERTTTSPARLDGMAGSPSPTLPSGASHEVFVPFSTYRPRCAVRGCRPSGRSRCSVFRHAVPRACETIRGRIAHAVFRCCGTVRRGAVGGLRGSRVTKRPAQVRSLNGTHRVTRAVCRSLVQAFPGQPGLAALTSDPSNRASPRDSTRPEPDHAPTRSFSAVFRYPARRSRPVRAVGLPSAARQRSWGSCPSQVCSRIGWSSHLCVSGPTCLLRRTARSD